MNLFQKIGCSGRNKSERLFYLILYHCVSIQEELGSLQSLVSVLFFISSAFFFYLAKNVVERLYSELGRALGQGELPPPTIAHCPFTAGYILGVHLCLNFIF